MEWLVIGTVAAGKIWAADQQADAMEESARIARIQAQISLEQAQFNAKMQKQSGQEESVYRRTESRKAVGGAVAAIAGSGVELSGSPLVMIGEHIKNDEINAARVITNAEARAASELARGKGQAATYMAQAAGMEKQADVTRTAGFLDALSFGIMAGAQMQSQTGGAPVGQTQQTGGYDYAWEL